MSMDVCRTTENLTKLISTVTRAAILKTKQKNSFLYWILYVKGLFRSTLLLFSIFLSSCNKYYLYFAHMSICKWSPNVLAVILAFNEHGRKFDCRSERYLSTRTFLVWTFTEAWTVSAYKIVYSVYYSKHLTVTIINLTR